tara:strand:+ start:3152 stop:4081 length:930 start_codon:yes stop_codon:yes gene_type:complete
MNSEDIQERACEINGLKEQVSILTAELHTEKQQSDRIREVNAQLIALIRPFTDACTPLMIKLNELCVRPHEMTTKGSQIIQACTSNLFVDVINKSKIVESDILSCNHDTYVVRAYLRSYQIAEFDDGRKIPIVFTLIRDIFIHMRLIDQCKSLPFILTLEFEDEPGRPLKPHDFATPSKSPTGIFASKLTQRIDNFSIRALTGGGNEERANEPVSFEFKLCKGILSSIVGNRKFRLCVSVDVDTHHWESSFYSMGISPPPIPLMRTDSFFIRSSGSIAVPKPFHRTTNSGERVVYKRKRTKMQVSSLEQ